MARPSQPSTPQQILDRAVAAHRQGRLDEAERLYKQILERQPDHFDALHMLGVVRHQQGRDEQALDLVRAALTARPGSAWALNTQGVVLGRLGKHAEALTSYDRALSIAPADLETLLNRGNALQALGRHEEAVVSYDKALAIRPDYVEALNNRGNALQELRRYQEALASYDRALVLAPNHPHAHYDRGVALHMLGRYTEAVGSYGRATSLDPNYADAHWSEALARLTLGDYAAGWKKFEWRFRTSDVSSTEPKFPQPQWKGEPLEGKTVLIHAEQGLGDAIQFARYVPMVAGRGGTVLLAVHSPLRELMSGIAGAAAVFGEDEPLPDFELQCPMMSLPLAFGTTLATVPAEVPYLAAAPERVSAWRERLPSSGMLRVGLAWSGSTAYKYDRGRSITFERLAPLWTIEGIEFVSLHRDQDLSRADLAAAREHPQLRHFSEQAPDLADTAAIMSQLDLVIAVNSSLAHLAGALGRPLWVLVPVSPDWRWMIERDDSPWYPTARLFRQPAVDDWDSVLARVREALVQFKKP